MRGASLHWSGSIAPQNLVTLTVSLKTQQIGPNVLIGLVGSYSYLFDRMLLVEGDQVVRQCWNLVDFGYGLRLPGHHEVFYWPTLFHYTTKHSFIWIWNIDTYIIYERSVPAPLLEILNGTSYIALRSIASKLVSGDEFGEFEEH